MGRSLYISILYCAVILSFSSGQGNYHDQLQAQLKKQYGLEGGEWVLETNEHLTNRALSPWGEVTRRELSIKDQPFTVFNRVATSGRGDQFYHSGWRIANQTTIEEGDHCLVTFWARCHTAASGKAIAQVYFEAGEEPYEKEFFVRMMLDTAWRQFFLPFRAARKYGPNEGSFGFHLAFKAQSIDLGGIAILNYRQKYGLPALPRAVGNEAYAGDHPDAAWRIGAASRIEQYRKAHLNIKVTDGLGRPISGAAVKVSMKAHEFAFGTSVVSCRFPGNRCQDELYQQKLLDLDGKGHGFNWAVPENAFKWRAWEEEWPDDKAGKVRAVQWLVDHGLKIRGHNLIWLSKDWIPADVLQPPFDKHHFEKRVDGHLRQILSYPGIAGQLEEWDVLNEATLNPHLEQTLKGLPDYPAGREWYAEIFRRTRDLAEGAKLYINDQVTISMGGEAPLMTARYKTIIREILESGAQLDGIGFQAHITDFAIAPEMIYNILEDFALEFPQEFKITEFDMEGLPQALEPAYLRDFLTIIFSHPRVTGFFMWGFWDGNHWKGNAPLFNLDWTLKASGQAFLDLVFKDWWTEESLATDLHGEATSHGFKGRYEVEVQKGNTKVRTEVFLSEDQDLTIKLL